MRIRCERCATTYELDERRLPPHGALVKCTRCDHVFRAAPPVGASRPEPELGRPPEASPGDRANGEERTALFGFSSPAGDDGTASIPAAPVPPAAPSTVRAAGASPAGAVEPSRSGRATRRAEGGGGRTWWWVLLAAILAAAILGGGYWLAQRKAATPTTRLPAGAELFPT